MIALGVLAILGAAGLTAAVVDVGGESHDNGEDDQYDDQSAAYTKDTGDTGDVSQAAGIDNTDLDDKLINFDDVAEVDVYVTGVTVVCRPLNPEDVPTSDDDGLTAPDSDPIISDDDDYDDRIVSDVDDDETSDDDDLNDDDFFNSYDIVYDDNDDFSYSVDQNSPPTEGNDDFYVIGTSTDPITLDKPLDMLDGDNIVGLKHVIGSPSQTAINAGEGSDMMVIVNSANLSLDTGDGEGAGVDFIDIINSSNVSVVTHGSWDDITIRNSSNVNIEAGEGDDSIHINHSSNLSLDVGEGDDEIYVDEFIDQGHNPAASEISEITLGEGADSVWFGLMAGYDGAPDVSDDGYVITKPFQIMDFDPKEDQLNFLLNSNGFDEFPAVQDVIFQQVALADSSGYQTDVKVVFEKMEDADHDGLSTVVEVTIFSKTAFGVDDLSMYNTDGVKFDMSSMTT